MGCLCSGQVQQNLRKTTPKCSCGVIIDETSIEICGSHSMCKQCALRSLSLKLCSICNKGLMHNQQEQIRNKYSSICRLCEEYSIHFQTLRCGCEVCIDCEKNSCNENKCKICQQVLKEESSMPSTSQIMCEICITPIKVQETASLDCQHFFHVVCVKEYITYLIKNESRQIYFDKGIKCPQCSRLIDGNFLSNFLDFKQSRSLTMILNPDIVECPGCEILFIPMAKRFICSCGASFCITCKKNSDNCDCDKNEGFALTDEMSCCPGCKSAYLKDEKCDHVKCQNILCGVEFCFKCSAYRDPTLKHGNHYHRPSCQFYSNYSGNDIYKADCSRCSYFKRLCDQPRDLRRRCRFEDGET